MTDVQRIDLREKFASFTERWSPKIVAQLNGQDVKVVKIQGEFPWHHHADEDELFLVHRGRLRIEFRDRAVELGEGQMLMVPRGIEHRPVAESEAEIILFEPAGTRNTGNLVNERTVASPPRI